MQVVYDIRSYTAETAFRQVALHMLRNPDKFYPLLQNELLETGESYESFCVNVFHGNVWGDDIIAAAFGDMWNVAITVVTPLHNTPLPLFHNKEEADVVVIVNGGCWRCDKKPTTHYSATSHKDKSFRIAGSSIYDTHKEADSIAKVLTPTLLVNKEEARKRAITEYKKQEMMRSLKMLRSVATSINSFNEKITRYIEQSDDMVKEKEVLEYKLRVLGVSVEKIEEAGKIEERGFIRTEERERLDSDRKRKREEEQKEEEVRRQESKKQEVGGEKKRKSYEDEDKQDEGDDQDESFTDKRARQQQEILNAQETIMNRQTQELDRKEKEIRDLQAKLAKRQKVIEIDDDDDDEDESEQKKKQKTGTSLSTPGAFSLQKLNPNLLKWLGKEPKKEESKDQPISEEETSTGKRSATQVSTGDPKSEIYVQKIQGNQVLVLESVSKKSTERRSGKTQPVPKGIRKDKKFYCEQCKSVFSRKDGLATHIKWECLQQVRQFICEKCQSGYYSETAVREHYYQVHLKQDLYFCKQCGQGFAHKSRKSSHKTSGACPNKDGEDKYIGRAPYDEKLEATFKRRTIMPLDIAEAEMPQAEETQAEQEPEPVPEPEPEPAPKPEPEDKTPGQEVVQEEEKGHEGEELGENFGQQMLPQVYYKGQSVEDMEASQILTALSTGELPSNIMEGDESEGFPTTVMEEGVGEQAKEGEETVILELDG